MTATRTPPDAVPVVFLDPGAVHVGPGFVDASADPVTVELPVLRGPVAVPPPVRRRGRQGPVVALALAAALLVVGGVVAAVLVGTGLVGEARADSRPPVAAPAAAFDVTGAVVLDGPVAAEGLSCTGSGGYADVRPGAPVTVADSAGTVVATGALAAGSPVSPTTCTFPFTVPGVPSGSPFYLVEVGQHGAVTYSGADLLRYGAALNLDR